MTLKPQKPTSSAKRAFQRLTMLEDASQASEATSPTQRWLLPYADMMTALFGVFLVCGLAWFQQQAVANQQAAHWEQQAWEQQQLARQHTKTLALTQQQLTALRQQLDATKQALTDWKAKDTEEAQAMSWTQDDRGLVVSLDETILFAPGQATLPAEGQAAATMAALAKVLSKTSAPIRVEGHTDDTPIHTAQFDSNWELSTARAVALVRALSHTYGIAPARLSATGYASHRPVADNSTVEGKQKNRRVDIVIEGVAPAAQPTASPAERATSDDAASATTPDTTQPAPSTASEQPV